jgi:hypothetical protein
MPLPRPTQPSPHARAPPCSEAGFGPARWAAVHVYVGVRRRQRGRSSACAPATFEGDCSVPHEINARTEAPLWAVEPLTGSLPAVVHDLSGHLL